MASVDQLRHAFPSFRTARLVGIFNIIFATQILACGLCLSCQLALLPFAARFTSGLQKTVEAELERIRQAEVRNLEKQEKAAKTLEQKVLARVRREEAEKRPLVGAPPSMDLDKLGLTDATVRAWSWAEVISGVILNVLLMVSGVGLLHWRGWARQLGIWTAALKVVRLVVFYGFAILVIVPPMSRNMAELVLKTATLQVAGVGPGATMPDAVLIGRVYTVIYSMMSVGLVVLGSIYPLIVLWLLTRPGVKSACSGVYKLPPEPNQPC